MAATQLKHKRGTLRMKRSRVGFLFALPSLIGFMLFIIIPLGISFYYCFTEGIGGTTFVGFKNFMDLLNSRSFLLAARNTLLFNGISVPLILLLSFCLAQLLHSKLKGLSLFRSLYILPLVVPVASVIMVWNILFQEYGILNHLLESFHKEPVDWIRSDGAIWILVLLYIWKNCGYNVILFLAGFNSIPEEYYEAARMDGAGAFQRLIHITLPFMIPTGFFVFMVSIVNSFKVFREAYLLAGNYPPPKLYMLQHFMNNNFTNLSYQRLSTSAFLMIIVIAGLVIVLYKVESKFGRSL